MPGRCQALDESSVGASAFKWDSAVDVKSLTALILGNTEPMPISVDGVQTLFREGREYFIRACVFVCVYLCVCVPVLTL